MDVEGFEWQVFRDILKTEDKRTLPKQISFELHVHSTNAVWSPPIAEFGNPQNWLYLPSFYFVLSSFLLYFSFSFSSILPIRLLNFSIND